MNRIAETWMEKTRENEKRLGFLWDLTLWLKKSSSSGLWDKLSWQGRISISMTTPSNIEFRA